MKTFNPKRVVIVDLNNLPPYLFRDKIGRLQIRIEHIKEEKDVAAVEAAIELLNADERMTDQRSEELAEIVRKSWLVTTYLVAVAADRRLPK